MTTATATRRAARKALIAEYRAKGIRLTTAEARVLMAIAAPAVKEGRYAIIRKANMKAKPVAKGQVSGATYGSYAAYVQAVKAEQTAYRSYRIMAGKHIRAMKYGSEADIARAEAKREQATKRLEQATEAKRAADSAYRNGLTIKVG